MLKRFSKGGGEYTPLLHIDSLEEPKVKEEVSKLNQWLNCSLLTVFAILMIFIAVAIVGLSNSYRFSLPGLMEEDPDVLIFDERKAYQKVINLVQIANDTTSRDQFGNWNIRGRVSMTKERDMSADYIQSQLQSIKENVSPLINMTIIRQVSSGVLQNKDDPYILHYESVVNIIAIISKNDAQGPYLLVSAHYDSVAYSPGASDNAAAVATCLEVIRVLSLSDPLPYPVIFLFDDGEEGGLMGADAFCKENNLEVATHINLDSNGGWGRAILTQLGPSNLWLAKAYNKGAKYHYGSVLVQDLFGILPSGTNYEIFISNGIPGMDIDLFLNDYTYHTELDSINDYKEGTLQAMGENVLGLLKSVQENENYVNASDTFDKEKDYPTVTFFDVAGVAFFSYDHVTAISLTAVNAVLLIALLFWFVIIHRKRREFSIRWIGSVVLSLGWIPLSFFLSVGAGIGMAVASQKTGSVFWFSNIPLGFFTYASLTFFIMCAMQYVPMTLFQKVSQKDYLDSSLEEEPRKEYETEIVTVISINVFHLGCMIFLNAIDFGSAYIFMWWCSAFCLSGLIFLLISTCFTDIHLHIGKLTPLFYIIWALFPLIVTVETLWRAIIGLTPQLGRLGVSNDSPIPAAYFAAISSSFAFLILVPAIPLLCRIRKNWIFMTVSITLFLVLFLTGCYGVDSYTETKVRRVDLNHFLDLGDGSSEPISVIQLSAPNPGDLSDILNENITGTNEWIDCKAYSYSFDQVDGLCQTNVPYPNVALPTITTEQIQYNETSDSWKAQITINSPNCPFYVLRINGDLVSWTASDYLPQRAIDFNGYLAIENGYAIIRRGQNQLYTFVIEVEGKKDVKLELIANYLMNTPLQREMIESLPKWAKTWGKSNNPGPVIVRRESLVQYKEI